MSKTRAVYIMIDCLVYYVYKMVMMNFHMVAGLLHDVSYGLSCLKWFVMLKMNEL